MNIIAQYDASTATAPAGFFTAVNTAIAQIDTLIANNITITIDFGWGEVNGSALRSGSLGESVSEGYVYPYRTVERGLQRDASSADDTASVASLPGSDPSHGAGIVATVAEDLAMGLGGAPTSPAGYVGLNAQDTWTFDPSHRAIPGAYDAVGVLLHEISEVLGRTSNVDDTSGQLNVFDLFRYAAAGVHTSADAGGWFSVDGAHLLAPFNDPANGGDPGDWATSQAGDAFAESAGSGREQLISTTDLRALDILGYQLTPGTALDGAQIPVSYELDGTSGAESLTGSGGADYIRGMDGNDTIDGGAGNDDVNGNKGDDVVHGGDGNDFVRGGQGNDQVFGDAGDDTVNGNLGDDTVHGGTGNDLVYGGQGNDVIFGDAGDDTLSGDLGNDTLTGGPGADRFVMHAGGGHDVVTDFNPVEGDRVMLSPGQVYSLSTANGSAVITLATGDTLTLLGVAQASADWVVFG